MKHFLIICLVLLCIIPFVSAVGTNVNTSLQTPSSAIWIRNQTVSTQTPESICAVYGRTPKYAPGQYGYNAVFLAYSTYSYGTKSNILAVDELTDGNLGSFPATQNLTFAVGPTYIAVGQHAICDDNGAYVSAMHPYYNNSLYAPPPIANFTAAPLNATAPAYVAFTDTSENETGTCTYNWSFSPSDGVMTGPGGLEQESPTVYFTEAGDYTVSHGVSCAAGSDIETKTDYIHIVNATGTITTCFAAIDALSGFQLSGANIQMYDIENTSWTNATSSLTGSECISTISDHTINAYTDMLGYDDGELLAVTPRASPDYPILMFPANATNVSAGNVTLYVTVRDMYSPGLPISGAQVDMTYNFPATEQKITGASGMVSFVVPNQTTIYLAAQKSGYVGKSASVDSGTGSGGDASISTTIYLPLKTITTAPTATTLPGGGTPTPQVTYLAHCDPSAADYDEALCRASKGGVGLNLLADYMDDLILLCIFVTIMYLLGFKLGG